MKINKLSVKTDNLAKGSAYFTFSQEAVKRVEIVIFNMNEEHSIEIEDVPIHVIFSCTMIKKYYNARKK